MPVALRERSNYIGIGKEGTWGTSVARTDFFEQRESNFNHVPSYGFRGGFRSASRIGRFKIKDLAEGNFSLDLLYDGCEKLFEAIAGSGSGATTGSATLGYTHTFNPKDAIPNGLSVEFDKDVGVYIAKGCELSRMRVMADARSDKPLLLEFGAVAREMIISAGGVDAPSGSIVYPSPLEVVLPNEITVEFDFGGVVNMTAKVETYELVFDNQYDNDRRSLGSTNILQPTRTGPRLAGIDLVAEFHDDADFQARAKSGLIGKVSLKHLSPTDIPGTSPLVKYTLDFILDDAFITAAPIPITGFGRVQTQVHIEGIEDTALAFSTLQIVNKNASTAI
jgi:hypothetical protein